MRTTIQLVPHTHWDREWYEPFQTFRMKLIELVDRVLELLDAEPDFRFTLDGQLATVDDYLEIRPAEEARIRRFVAEGRLAIGPWQILMDEFLVAGETIVRNLQFGTARASDFGRPMPVGYLPDMFGHIAQMPQILRRAGIEQAVVWRGVPARVNGNRFRWRAPDGSEVATEYLLGGYGNGAHMFDVPAEATAQATAYGAQMADFYGGPDGVLAMYGTDHMLPTTQTVSLVGDVNASGNGIALRLATLAEYIDLAAARDGAAVLVEGELRSGARANMLMGVNSAHVDIRRAAAHAERWLLRYAEPLAALHAERWPARLLELAWRRVVDNSAHDSICGCSLDPVTAQVLVRFAEAEQIARGVAERAAGRLAAGAPRGWRTWVNPTPARRAGLILLDLRVPADWPDVALATADGQRFATQEIERNEPLLFEQRMSGADAALFVRRRPHRRELFGKQINAARLERDPRRLVIQLDDEADPEWLDLQSLREGLIAGLETEADEEWLVRVEAAPRRRLWSIVEAPALGAAAGRPVAGAAPVSAPVMLDGSGLDNGHVRIEVAEDGRLTIVRDGVTIASAGRLVDGGDAGDSYNYAPPANDLLVTEPVEVSTRVAAAGPLVGRLVVERSFDWPAGLAVDRRSRSAAAERTLVTTTVELRAGEPFVRLALEFDNRSDDHRLRFHVPLPMPADRSAAEGQYAVVERGLQMEGGHGEVPLPTYPAYAFVAAGGVAALLDHITEYELVDDGGELALTCLRAFGWISRNDNPYREEPAGPEREVPAGQMRGHQ
ncbi:MAG TPA: glycoside hydrolase family 38 C-terminal domain-containing protein, partial [Candidatus Limnocylindria bacterium]|nr:glycoside hydrolase family 38 C-terminal domain-containing protein [Candidatus Limnocylindria bacterium]